MQVKILKLWHQWGWAFHISAWLVGGTVMICTYGNATASNTKEITQIQEQHKEENMATRMAVQEATTKDVNDRLSRIESVQGKIFDRVNQIADRSH